MQDTVARAAQQTVEGQPGWHLAPARFGKPGSQADAMVPCPDFCGENHVEDWKHHLVDLDHWGPTVADWDADSILNPGARLLALSARLYLDPNSDDPRMSGASVRVDDESVDAFWTPEMTEQAADGLIAFAAKLYHLARQARTFNEKAGRTDDTEARAWQSLTRDDLTRRPIASLLKVFGVDVVEADVESVVLRGEPGAMKLHVLPDVPQCLREDLARRALLAWFDARQGGDV
ncbi:DUF6907 domain-containing protein [Streptomyces sp. NPDC088350]|uniref:DUF6907 domain-containing protein n=1 Tax=Streptomyces sp. NPDC088350 TaxID=3365854 RepID=UPI0038176432